MNRTKNLTIINCLASAFIVYFITVPGHELLHVLTSLIYGEKILNPERKDLHSRIRAVLP